MALRRLGAALAIVLAIASPAAAANFEIGVEGRQLVMELAGHIVTIPGPLWAPSGETVDIEKTQVVYRQVGPGAESVLLLSVEDTLVTWTRMMGILAVGRPGYRADYQVASLVGPMREGCTPDQTLIRKIPAARAGGQDGLLLMCGRYRPTRLGPRNCAGGIIVAFVIESPNGAMKAYAEWCTGPFNVLDRAAWPVGGDELQARASELMEGTRFVPATPRPAAPPVDARPAQP
jgi:hypothetical protein